MKKIRKETVYKNGHTTYPSVICININIHNKYMYKFPTLNLNILKHKHNIYIAAYILCSADMMIAFSRSQQHAWNPKATLTHYIYVVSKRKAKKNVRKKKRRRRMK